jgi:LPPG:FO 2-phospho-L-lactate transferase
MNIVALAGGVGGAKLADGLQRVVGESLTVIVNTGDDFELHGLRISPDLDTVMYTLAGIANPEMGWGLAGDTFTNLAMLSRYGVEDWFGLGDRDLATHLVRTNMLSAGQTLTEVTQYLSRCLHVPATIVPMTDDRVATTVNTDEGELVFQEYFVHRGWQPVVGGVRFAGIEHACPSAEGLKAIERAELIVMCPSNPFVSLDPILSLRGMREKIEHTPARKIAVSPIVGGEALKGPAAKMFRELGIEPSALAVAQRYRGLVDGFVIDTVDADQESGIRDLAMDVLVTDTVMRDESEREKLAREVVEWGRGRAGEQGGKGERESG